MSKIDEEILKEAFSRVRIEFDLLRTELFLLKREVEGLRNSLDSKVSVLSTNSANYKESILSTISNQDSNKPTTHLPQSNTYSYKFEGDKPYLPISIGNEGVPTNPQQTNTQSNTSPTDNFTNKSQQIETKDIQKLSIKELVNSMKEELKAKFKGLTKQEFYVFSTIFSLEQDLRRPLSYKDISNKTNLTESTIRDYIGRLIAKGIPIVKERVNNKDILIKITEDLRNLASLDSLSNIRKQI